MRILTLDTLYIDEIYRNFFYHSTLVNAHTIQSPRFTAKINFVYWSRFTNYLLIHEPKRVDIFCRFILLNIREDTCENINLFRCTLHEINSSNSWHYMLQYSRNIEVLLNHRIYLVKCYIFLRYMFDCYIVNRRYILEKGEILSNIACDWVIGLFIYVDHPMYNVTVYGYPG